MGAFELTGGASVLVLSAGFLASCLRLRSPLAFMLAMNLIAWTAVVLFTLVFSPLRLVDPVATWAWLVALLALSVWTWLTLARPAPPLAALPGAIRGALAEPAVRVLAVFVVPTTAYVAALAVGTPENEGDALSYHVARAAFWNQHHGVAYVANAIETRLNVSPPNAEVADLFTMVLSGSQRFVGLVVAAVCQNVCQGIGHMGLV